MAIALVAQDANATSGPSGANATIACTSSTAGNLMVLVIHVQSTTVVVNSVTDNLGGAWVKAVDLSTSGSYTGIWYLVNCPAGITSVTAVESAGTAFNGNVSQWSGVVTSAPVRATNTAAVTTSPNRTGTASATAGDLAIGGISANSATARTLSAPFTALTTGVVPASFSGLHAYDLPGSSGTEEGQWTTASAANTGGVIALFIPAAGGPVTVTVTPAAATWSAVAVTAVPQPVTVALTPAATSWAAVPVVAVPQPVTVVLTPAAATWAAVPVTALPQPVTVALTRAATTWSAVAVTATPLPITVALTRAQTVWSAVPVSASGGAVSVALTAAATVWTAVAVTPVGHTVQRPDAGITLRPSTGTTARFSSGTTARPGSGITVRPNAGTTTRP